MVNVTGKSHDENATDDGKENDLPNADEFDNGKVFQYYQPGVDIEEKSECGDILFKTPISIRSNRSAMSLKSELTDDDSIDNGCCIDPKYKIFHEEITENKVYKLSDLQYYDTYITAVYYMKSEGIKNLKAKKVGLLNSKSGIIPGTPIGINHIMSLLFYANFHRLQQEFKKLFGKRRDGDIDKLYAKHGIIGHWSRYISEAVNIFGDVYGEKDGFLYTALDKPMLFSEWNIGFKKPLSTTDDLWIIRKFVGRSGGVVLKLMYKEPARYFDLRILTDFHNEREKVFMSSRFVVLFFFVYSSA